VVAALQDPRKDVLTIRNLFPDRIAMRLDEPEQTDMVLGDGARDRGAACELISTDPAVGAGVAFVRLEADPDPVRVKPWTAEEARQFLELAKQDRDPLYAAYVLILVMGLRKGEVVGLPWSAVNLDRGELEIGWQLQRVSRQLLHRETKTEASEATLPLPSICVTALRIREKDQAAAKDAVGASWTHSGWCSRPGSARHSSRGT
jgi:integrase